jgi:hypothetical protein
MPFTARKANFNALRKLNLQDRIAAVQDQQTGQFLISMLTPTQAAELFPHYYIERNPNISGFLRAIPSSLSAMKQREYEQQLNNTASGSSAGSNFNAGGYRKKWQENMDAERAAVSKKGYKPPPQLSPEQKAAFDALKAGDIAVNDERMKWLKNAPEEIRKEVGITITKDDKGNEKFHYAAPQISEEEAKASLSSSGSLKQMIDAAAAKHNVDPKIMYGIVRGESGHGNIYDRNINSREESWGPFQMNRASWNPGLGSDFERETGLSVRDPSSLSRQADWIAAKIAAHGGDRRWVASQWYGYGSDVGGPKDFDARAAGGARDWNKSWGTMGSASNDPITQNYTSQQIAARREQLAVEAEAGRLGKLASVTQPEQTAITSTAAAGGTTGSWLGESKQCVALSKHFAPQVGPASTWNVKYNPDGIVPGAVIATTSYNDHSGGKMARDMPDGKSHYHTGIALTKPDAQGNVLILDQHAGRGASVTRVNINDYHGEKWGIVGNGQPTESSMAAINMAKSLASPEQKMLIEGTSQPSSIPASVAPSAEKTVKDSTTKSNNEVAARQDVTGGIKPLTDVTQPGGPTNTPAAAPTAKVEQPKASPSGNRFTFNKDAYLNEVGTKQPLAYSFVGPGREGVWNDTVKGLREAQAQGVLSYDEKSGALNIKDMNHPKVQEILGDMKKYNLDKDTFMKKHEDVPTQVKPKAQGGTTKVSTEEIAAYPIGGLQGDNAVVVNAQQKPLFTMNTNEAAVMNPDTKTVDVLPNKKNNALGPQQQTDTAAPMMNEFQSAIQDLQKGFADMQTKTAKAPDLNKQATDQLNQNWLAALGHVTEIPYRNPTAHRVASRANGVETGSADNNYHYSKGNRS